MTRNFYVRVSRTFAPYQDRLRVVLAAIWLGGFALLGVVMMVFKAPAAFVLLGKAWITSCVVIGIIHLCTHSFNPNRDPVDSSREEGWDVVMINITVVFTVWMWFWKE